MSFFFSLNLYIDFSFFTPPHATEVPFLCCLKRIFPLPSQDFFQRRNRIAHLSFLSPSLGARISRERLAQIGYLPFPPSFSLEMAPVRPFKAYSLSSPPPLEFGSKGAHGCQLFLFFFFSCVRRYPRNVLSSKCGQICLLSPPPSPFPALKTHAEMDWKAFPLSTSLFENTNQRYGRPPVG